jgi:Tol biopolymer transport system component
MVQKVLIAGLAIAGTAAVATLGTLALRHVREIPAPPPASLRLSFAAPANTELGSGDDILDAAISPDQRQVVFVATGNGSTRLWRRALDDDRAEAIAGTDGARLPAWKQTRNVVSFFAGDRLKQVSVTDGTVRDLTAASAALGASWLPDGSLLYAPDARGVIRRLRSGTVSDATRLRRGDRSHAFPMAAGEGDVFVYTATLDTGRRVVRLAEAGGERDLVTTTGHGQLVGDTLLYVSDGALLGQRLDPETRLLSGRAVPLALDVGTDQNGHGSFAASPRVLAAAPGGSRRVQLTWLPLGREPRATTREPGDYWQVRLSPDDRVAALTQTTPLVRTLDIVLVPMVEKGYVEPLTRAVAADSDPVWSPDGRTLAFRSLQDGAPRLYTRAAHDQDGADAIVPMSADATPTDWHDDGLFVHAPGAKGDLDVWAVNVRTGARQAIAVTGFNETDARLSPDGRWLAYVSDESGQADIYATPWPRGARVRISFAGGTRPRWGRDGRTVFFLRGAEIMRADLSASGFTTPSAVLEIRDVRDFDVAHRRDAVLALIPAASSTNPATTVIVDWQSLVK